MLTSQVLHSRLLDFELGMHIPEILAFLQVAVKYRIRIGVCEEMLSPSTLKYGTWCQEYASNALSFWSRTVLPLRCTRRAHGQDRPIPVVVSREREKKHLGVSQRSRFWREPMLCWDSPPANLRPSTWSPILSDAVRYHLMSSWILEYYVSRISARYLLPMT